MRPLDNDTAGGVHPGRLMFRKGLEAVKIGVLLEMYARQFTELKSSGLRLIGRCPNPDHEDRTPSFHIWPDEDGGSWWCFGCSRGGDVLNLFMAVECWPKDDYGPALAALAEQWNVELPQRPPEWFEWQNEKGRRRAELTKIRTRLYQRRLLRLFREDLEGISDLEERQREAERIYGDLYYLALRCALQREAA